VTYAKRTDANQKVIVAALRAAGATVFDLSRVGGGCPDIAVGFRGKTYLMEIKSEGGKLNKKQVEWQEILHLVQ